MLPDNPKNDPNDAAGARQDYLELPYNDPIRQRMRGMEDYYGMLFQKENARAGNLGGFFSGALAAISFIGGYVAMGPGRVIAGAVLGGGAAGLIPAGGGAAGAVAGGIVGGAAGAILDAVVNTKLLLPLEWQLAIDVFGGSLPPREQILLTDLSGAGGRGFTYPGSAMATLGALLNPAEIIWLLQNPSLFSGKIIVNLGEAFNDPINYTSPNYPSPGQLLIHELTHAWQIYHSSFSLGFVCEAAVVQTRNTLGEKVYRATPGEQWGTYNLEQQASLVDTWFANSRTGTAAALLDPRYRYLTANIRPGDPNATSSDPIPAFVAPEVRPIDRFLDRDFG